MKAYYPDPDYPFLSVSLVDGVYVLLYLVVVYIVFSLIANKASPDEKRLQYFLPGLSVKLFSALAFCLIYLFHYGGDTLAYFHNMQVLKNLFYSKPIQYFELLVNGPEDGTYYFFTHQTGIPGYMWRDGHSFFVSRLLSPITIIFGDSFLLNTMVVATLSYLGSWKLFLMFSDKFPQLTRQMAIACLFIPSVVFWGSGIMKDTIIVFSLSMTLVSINQILQQKLNIRNFVGLVLSVWLMILIKPYVFVALLPGVFIWVGYEPLQKIRSKLLRIILIPFITIVVIGGVMLTFSQFSSSLGKYGDFESMMTKAKVTQQDLMRTDLYSSNFFNIGEITGTPGNLARLFPKAVMAGLFRPYLWEVRNVFMLMSGLENFILLMLVLSVFFRRNVRKVFQLIGKEPFLLGLFIFIIFLAFGVGLSTANFGALVRYRIPVLPVFVAAMFILKHFVKTRIEQPKVQRKDFSFGVE